MKTFTFRYVINPSSMPPEPGESHLNSIPNILSLMSAVRIQLFYAIGNHRPESMYHLAQLLKRDHSNVIRDVKALEGLGLIQLLAEKSGERERLRPVALYDRIVFDFGTVIEGA